MAQTVVRSVGGGVLELCEGDITGLAVDAVVNAANSGLRLGAGVAGAIRRRGGDSIQEECDAIGHCPVGGAVVTGGGDLPARHVIHAVGPVWNRQSPDESDRLLASAAREALARAGERGLGSIALPSISTGVYGFPVNRAAGVLLREAVAHLRTGGPPERVVLCLFGDEAFAAHRDALERVLAENDRGPRPR
jgi:O-acetyl-ADP-ribose deacetylase (regulator of RNase III)